MRLIGTNTAETMQMSSVKKSNAAGIKRNEDVLAAVGRQGETSIQAVAGETKYSISTVQRAVADLVAGGDLVWLKGGGVALKSVVRDEGADQDPDESANRSTATKVLKIIRSNHVIVLEGSPFSLALARQIDKSYTGNIITNSPRIAQALSEHPHAKVQVIGGRLQNDVMIPVERDIRFLETVAADPCVLGRCSVDLEDVSVSDADELEIKKAMIARARTVVVPVSRGDLNQKSNFILAPSNKITHLVLRNGVGSESLKEYEQMGLEIIRP